MLESDLLLTFQTQSFVDDFFKWAFLKISQILPENSFVGVSFLIKLQAYTPTQVFPVKLEKFFRTPILKNICKRLLLKSQLLLTFDNHDLHFFYFACW